MRVAVIDLDRVVANNAKRFAEAEKAKKARERELIKMIGGKGKQREVTKAYWNTAFDPALVELDELMVGSKEALTDLEEQGYYIVFLTSRPETMKEATIAWLCQHKIFTGATLAGTGTFWGVASATVRYGRDLIMKPLGKQFVKTAEWKASEIQIMANLDIVESILFVDDEERNREAVEALKSAKVTCKSNLSQILQQSVTRFATITEEKQ